MSYKSLHLLIGNDNYDLKFDLLDTPLTELWVERMDARGHYPLDHPQRVVGFNDQAYELARTETKIRELIDIINSHTVIIDRKFTNGHDQEYLNYLHTIFEHYHGGLDKQTHEYWLTAPVLVRQALAEVNVTIHQCESAARMHIFNTPRIVCTWWGMPKIKTLPQEYKIKYGVLNPPWGSICLSYAEIGKTIEDLAYDNDVVTEDAFKPFNHYSADFVARFFEFTSDQINTKLTQMKDFYNTHYEFFQAQGITSFDHPDSLPLRFPVAHLANSGSKEEIMSAIQQRQYVNKVYLE